MKVIALDVGSKRIGVAVADTSVRIAVPHSTIEVDGTEFEQIAKIISDEGSNRLVVGLPRNGNGEESAQSAAVRSFIVSLQDYFVKHKLERPLVKYQDESLTSVKAEENLALNKRKKNRAKGEVDREAATIILQDFLDSFNAGAAEDEGFDAKKKSKRRGRGFRIFATIVALIIVAAVAAIAWYTDALKAPDPSNCREVAVRCDTQEFVILEGESVGEVTERLRGKNLIKSELAFRVFLKLEQREKAIKAGVFVLNSGMTAGDVVNALNSGSDKRVFRLEIMPGETLDDVRQRLVTVGYDKEEVDTAFARTYKHSHWGNAELKVGDFLFAGVYEVGVGAKVEDVVALILGRLAVVSADNYLKDQYARMGLSFEQAFRLAARVRTEVGEVSERAQAEIRKAAELIKNGDTEGKTDVAADIYALAGVAYYESRIPFVASGDYKGWMDVYGELAREVGAQNGIPYEAMLAQSILESSWGKSKLAYKYFNFFGIKYMNMPKDEGVAPVGSVNMETWEEYEPGVSSTITANFAVWDSVETGFRAYTAWIKAQSRYAAALKYPNDPIRYIEELKRAGYATDSNYVATLKSIIESLRGV